MTSKEKTIINKLRLLIKLEAWDEINKSKYHEYLTANFSCEHCKYGRGRCSGHATITNTGIDTWCFTWLKDGLDKSKYI